MRKILVFSIFLISLFISSVNFFPQVYAADIRTGNNIFINDSEENLSDLYLFGKSITVGAPVKNDFVAAGQDIIIEKSVSGDILVAGGNLRIVGDSGGSVRVGGGNVWIEGGVGRDLVVGGGHVTISKSATIGGDLIIAGGDLTVNGTVRGKAIVNGGQVRIDGAIGKNVQGNVGKLTIGSKAVIGGNLVYSSSEKAVVEDGALVTGDTRYTQIAEPKKAAKQLGDFITGFSVYKLVADIILTIGLIYFFGAFLKLCFDKITESPLLSGVYGFAFLALVPLASLILLILLWLGLGTFMFYALVLLFSVFVTKAFLGWILVKWWYGRDKKVYRLDWKAGVAGPIVLFVIAFIPVIGWLVLAILYLVSVGAVVWELSAVFQNQKIAARKK